MKDEPTKPNLIEWLGLEKGANLLKSRGLGGFVGFLLVGAILLLIALFFLALAAAFVVVYATFNPTAEVAPPNLGVGALLTALLSAPFVIWRTMVAQWTVDHQRKAHEWEQEKTRQSIWNEQMAAASKDLAAWREVTKEFHNEGDRHYFNVKEPDLITRSAAIDTMFGLVQDRPSEASRIAGLLSQYVREHSVHSSRNEPDVPIEKMPRELSGNELRAWTIGLKPSRSDLQKAVQTIGMLPTIKNVVISPTAINFRDANLQGFNLDKLIFGESDWTGANLQGATFRESELANARFIASKMQGTVFYKSNLRQACFRSGELASAVFSFANLEQADLGSARLHDSNFGGANLKFAYLSGAELMSAKFIRADLRGANLTETNLFATRFTFANLQGADISASDLDIKTEFGKANLEGMAVRFLRAPHLPNLVELFINSFGDGKNELATLPSHWPKDELSDEDFNRAWRDWVAKEHPDVLQYLPEHVQNA